MNLKLYKNRIRVEQTIERMASDIQVYLNKQIKKKCFITILKGGNFTASAIIRNLNLTTIDDVVFGYLGLSSYKHGTISSKHVEVTYPLELDEDIVDDRIVWIVDDIKDSGLTLWIAQKIVQKKYPKATVRTAVLIDKPDAHAEGVPKYAPDVSGFKYTGDKFLVGCGLGLGEQFRGIPALYELEE